jgi:hypothetical protein
MSTRDKAVDLAQHYLVRNCPGVRDDSDGNAEVENMIDLIIEAAATKAVSALASVNANATASKQSSLDAGYLRVVAASLPLNSADQARRLNDIATRLEGK